MGSALLDTYLSMIAAAGGGGSDGGPAGAMASALQNFGRFGAAAAASAKHHANAAGTRFIGSLVEWQMNNHVSSLGGGAHNGDNENKDVSDDEQMEQGE